MLPRLAQHPEAERRHGVDRPLAEMRQRLGGEIAVQDVGRHRQAVRAGIVGHADDRRGTLPPVVMVLGLPARQRPAVLDEGAGVEVADAADVRIERQEAAEAQHRRHLQLDHLLPVPARHGVEAAERGRRNRSPSAHRHSILAKRGRLVRSSDTSARGATISSSNGLAVAPMLGQRFDQQSGAFKIASALQLAQSQRQDGLADFREHSAGLAMTPYLGTAGRLIN